MKKTNLKITGLILSVAMLLSSCSSVSAMLPNGLASELGSTTANAAVQTTAVPTQQIPVVIQPGLLGAYEATLEAIYNNVNPSVVNIEVLQKQDNLQSGLDQFPNFPFEIPGFPQIPNNPNSNEPQYSHGLGSGFVWDQQGHIVTNNHVIDSADKVEVTFADGTRVSAKVVGADANSDLAVIQVDTTTAEFKPVQLADSNQVKVGQVAIAIGNPYGLQGTMTVGIVSAVGRSLPAGEGNQDGTSYSIPNIIQTDAPINPGNSGGVLVDDQGKVIGVTAAIESPTNANAGIGFAIPSAIVQKVVPSLISTGGYKHPYLGISGMALNPDIAKAMNLKSDQRGALVEEIVPGGPADKAGLRGSDRQFTINGQDIRIGGDVIIAIDDQAIKDMDDLIAYLTDHTVVGQKAVLTILRDGKETSIDVTLGERPSSNQSGTQAAATESKAWLGIVGIDMTAEIAKNMQIASDQQGVLVQQVQTGSPADQAGLQGSYKPVNINGNEVLVGGDVITALNGHSVTGMNELKTQLADYQPGDKVTLTILRGEEKIELELTLGQGPTG